MKTLGRTTEAAVGVQADPESVTDAAGCRPSGLHSRPPRETAPEAPKEQAPPEAVSFERRRRSSDVEAELDYVAVLHDVVLAFHADLADGAGLDQGAGLDEVGVGDDLGLDEAALEVGVDDAGGFGGGGAAL